jgi:hypothetical protein
MNQVELTIAAIMRQDPTISEAEARQMAEAQHAPEARTDGAPSAPLTPDVQLDYPEQKYKYNPVSRTWDDVGAGSSGPGLRPGDRSADTDPRVQSGEFGYRFGGQVPHASADEAADYSTRPAAGPSQQDLDMLQTGDINRSGTGWVAVYGPDGTTRLMRRAPAPETSVRPTQYGRPHHGNPVVLEEGGVYVGDVPMEQSQGYRQPEDTPGANLAAAYSGATGFRDWTVDGDVPEYAQGYDWGGPEEGWANEATGGGRIGRSVTNRDVQRDMPRELPGGSSEYDRVPTLVDSPNGPVWVYDYEPESQSQRDINRVARDRELQLRRMSGKAGITMAKARQMRDADVGEGGLNATRRDPNEVQSIRDLVVDRRNQDKEARRKAYTDRNMLAGNDPRQNLVNAYNTLDPEMQQQAMLGMMFQDGATPLDVQQARAMAEARINAHQALSDPLAQQVREQQLRQANPAAAGASDIASGQYTTPEALAELERLTVQHDTTTGGFDYEDEQALARTLQGPTYNLGQAEAEALAYQQAQTRRWRSGRPPSQGPVGPGGELPADRQGPSPPVDQPLPPPGMWGNFPPNMPSPRQWGPAGAGAAGPSAWGGAGG